MNKALSKMQPSQLRDDLKQEIFLILCNLSEEKFWNLYNNNALKFWFVRTMLNLIYQSRPSESFYRNFRAKFECIDDFNKLPDLLEDVQGESSNKEIIFEKLELAFDNLHWYEKGLMEVYIECKMNKKEVARQTKIPYMSIVNTIAIVKEKIKEDLNN